MSAESCDCVQSEKLSDVCCVLACLLELIQTELHHMRTLQIMERVFRQGMLEELQLEPSTVHTLFPCLDQLIKIHSHFLAQLLLRRRDSLQPGSNYNYTIHQLGDILIEQVGAYFCMRILLTLPLSVFLKMDKNLFVCSLSSSQASVQTTCRRPTPSSAAAT